MTIFTRRNVICFAVFLALLVAVLVGNARKHDAYVRQQRREMLRERQIQVLQAKEEQRMLNELRDQ